MTIEQLNTFLKTSHPPFLVFITGASGTGKTFLTKALEQDLDPKFVSVNYFDQVGVPRIEEMIEKWGSAEKWQEITTYNWVQKLASIQDKKLIILEGQFNPQFALDACKEFKIQHFLFILLHADKKIREPRLIKQRVQPELANETMENWALFLMRKTQALGGAIIDTSDSDIESHLNKIADLIKENLHKDAPEKSNSPKKG